MIADSDNTHLKEQFITTHMKEIIVSTELLL